MCSRNLVLFLACLLSAVVVGQRTGAAGVATECAREYGVCQCYGEVRYGANGKFSAWHAVSGSVGCNNSVFGDPIHGVAKTCYCRRSTPEYVKHGKSQCYANAAPNNGDSRDNPIFGGGGFIGQMTGTECEAQCNDPSNVDEHGRECVAFEHSSQNYDAVANCALAWACDYTKSWNGGAAYIQANTIPRPAFWETCRWQSTRDQDLYDTQDLIGWTCADNEILTGFGINAKGDISRIQCCELGGHSSVMPDTCTFIGVDDAGFQPERASCNANDHRVFTGAYDASIAAGDDYTELLVGKCCEVRCDAPWCQNGDWGVNTDQCHTISADPYNYKAQDLVCPEGTLVTQVHDGHSGAAHGIQRVESVVCCELDMIYQPSKAPTSSPITSLPTKAPSPSPTTSPSPSPTTAPSPAPTSTSDCLLALFQCDSPLSDAEILQGIDDCLPDCKMPPHYYYRRALEGRLLSKNAE